MKQNLLQVICNFYSVCMYVQKFFFLHRVFLCFTSFFISMFFLVCIYFLMTYFDYFGLAGRLEFHFCANKTSNNILWLVCQGFRFPFSILFFRLRQSVTNILRQHYKTKVIRVFPQKNTWYILHKYNHFLSVRLISARNVSLQSQEIVIRPFLT